MVIPVYVSFKPDYRCVYRFGTAGLIRDDDLNITFIMTNVEVTLVNYKLQRYITLKYTCIIYSNTIEVVVLFIHIYENHVILH